MAINAANGIRDSVRWIRAFVESRSQRFGWSDKVASTVGLVMLAVWLLRDVLTALTWAALIALTAWPIYGRVGLLMPTERDVLAPLLIDCAQQQCLCVNAP